MSDWTIERCNYDYDANPGGQVLVTYLHWTATLVDGANSASRYGATPDDQNRVYAEAALLNVPESVIVGWAQAALGVDAVAEIEAGLLADIAEQVTPTTGSFNPT